MADAGGAAAAPPNNQLVVHGSTGRQLLFDPEDLALPECFVGKPWHEKQFAALRPIIVGRLMRGAGGHLAKHTVPELIAEMTDTVNRRFEAKREARKEYHKKKRDRERGNVTDDGAKSEDIDDAEGDMTTKEQPLNESAVVCIFNAGTPATFAEEGGSLLEDLGQGLSAHGKVASCRWLTVPPRSVLPPPAESRPSTATEDDCRIRVDLRFETVAAATAAAAATHGRMFDGRALRSCTLAELHSMRA